MKIGIIGSGFSGITCILAIYYALPTHDFTLDVYDPNEPFFGRALNTTSEYMLLNTSVSVCYTNPSDQNAFFNYLSKYKKMDIKMGDVVPRYMMRDFLKYEFERLVKDKNRVNFIKNNVFNISISSDKKINIQAKNSYGYYDAVILASGAEFKFLSEKYSSFNIIMPYPNNNLDKLSNDASVLVIGSKLTAVDSLLHLKGKGHIGPISIYSRSGLFPGVRNHSIRNNKKYFLNQYIDEIKHIPAEGFDQINLLLDKIDNYLRQHSYQLSDFKVNHALNLREHLNHDIKFCEERNNVWERILVEVIDSFAIIFSDLSDEAKNKFDKKIESWLGRHIHSMPIGNANKLKNLFDLGQLTLINSGRFANIKSSDYDVVINATGLASVIDDSLLRQMENNKLIKFNCNNGVSIENSNHRTKPDLSIYALGGLIKGETYAYNSIYYSAHGAHKIARDIKKNSERTHTEKGAKFHDICYLS